MGIVLFDTNILIDALNGISEAADELAYWEEPAISAMTWMEVYAGASRPGEGPDIDQFMRNCEFHVVPIDAELMHEAAKLVAERRHAGSKKIALTDAVIAATAKMRGLVIITRDKKDFKGADIRIPYELQTKISVSVINVNPPGDTPTASSFRSKSKRKKSAR
ncbi:PIN domain-containing protein [Oxalobacteraceae bacterium]|nr:PIN domain-containing protein [Oxalobacteraceae bacterium]